MSRNIDKVDTIVDDIREQADLANEISTAISQPMGVGMDFDDEELLDELRTLEQEELDSRLLGVESTPVNKAKEPGMFQTSLQAVDICWGRHTNLPELFSRCTSTKAGQRVAVG